MKKINVRKSILKEIFTNISGLNRKQKVIIIFLILFITFSLLLKIGFATSKSIDIRGVETNVLFSIQELMIGDQLYPDPEASPFSITQYMPLYYLVVAKIAMMFDVIPGVQFSKIYVIGRLLSVFLSLGLSFIVFLSCKIYGADFVRSSIGATLVFIIPIPWYSLLRPDALMAFFGISTIITYTVYLKGIATKQRKFILIICGSLGYISFLSKQNGIIFLVIIVLYSAIQFEVKEIIFILLGFFTTFILTSLIFQPFYNVNPFKTTYFYDHVIGGLNNGINLVVAYRKLYSLYFSWYLPFVAIPISGLFTVGRLIKKVGLNNADKIVTFLAFSFVCVTLTSLVAGIKDGSTINYMNESMIIGILLVIRLSINNYTNLNVDFKILFCTYGCIFLVAFLAHQTFLYRHHIDIIGATSSYEVDNGAVAFLQRELQNNPYALIYSMDPMINIIFFNQIIFPQKSISRTSFSRNISKFSEISVLLRDGSIRYIVATKNSGLPSIIFGINLNVGGFKLIYSSSTFDIYINQ